MRLAGWLDLPDWWCMSKARKRQFKESVVHKKYSGQLVHHQVDRHTQHISDSRQDRQWSEEPKITMMAE